VAVVGYAASAAPKVAITPIDGDSEGDVREAVTTRCRATTSSWSRRRKSTVR